MKQRKAIEWSKLDNAAKIFPSTSGKQDTKVFRFTCELKENVDKEILQKALDHSLNLFPFYRSILRRGLFWYYFESTDLHAAVKEEHSPPCSAMYFGDRKTLLLEVTYFQCRINLEMYHALTDGTGALQFLKILVHYYLSFRHSIDLGDDIPELEYDASLNDKMDDSFLKYYEKADKASKIIMEKAFHFQGAKHAEYRMSVIEGSMSVKSVLERAREFHTSVTVLLTALLLKAISEEMSNRSKRYPVVISVPINLRNYFSSDTARNFFGKISVSYNFKKQSNDLDDIITHVDRTFKEELTEEKVGAQMNASGNLEHNMLTRLVPLVFKDIGLKIGNVFFERSVTATLSNIGKISFPSTFTPFVNLFSVFISTKRLQICLCSYNDKLVIGFTSPFVNTNVQKQFFRSLTYMGIDVCISSNQAGG